MHVCLCVRGHMCTRMSACGGQRAMPSFFLYYSTFFETKSLTNYRGHWLCRLPGQCSLRLCPPYPFQLYHHRWKPPLPICMCVLGIWTQVPVCPASTPTHWAFPPALPLPFFRSLSHVGAFCHVQFTHLLSVRLVSKYITVLIPLNISLIFLFQHIKLLLWLF